MPIVLFIIILGIIIFVHEIGHFLVAKKSGLKVQSFAIGFPPTLWQWQRGETTYQLNLIPFGGYVKILGEEDADDITPEEMRRSLRVQPKYRQILVFIAGIVANIILAGLLLSGAYMAGTPMAANSVTGEQSRFLVDVTPTIVSVQPHSPAAEAGLTPGTTVQSVRVNEQNIAPVSTMVLSEYIQANPDAAVILNISTGEEIVLQPVDGVIAGKYAIGLGIEDLGKLRLPFFRALWQGFLDTGTLTKSVTSSYVQLLGEAFRGEARLTELSGPVGIVGEVKSVQQFGLSYLATFTAFISINIAILNLIPFPALDGGQILFVLIEAVTRRRIPTKVVGTLNIIGFGLLILLMLAVTWQDIARLIG